MEELEEVGVDLRLDPFRLNPNLAPTFFQPLLCAATARWKPPGDVLKVYSDVGGVVGGVMGSIVPGELLSLSSVSASRSTARGEADDEEDA